MTAQVDQNALEAWRRIVKRAWQDPTFKEALLANSREALAAAGGVLPDGIEIVAHEDTAERFHIVLPAESGGAISDDLLDKVAGGTSREPVFPTEFPVFTPDA